MSLSKRMAVIGVGLIGGSLVRVLRQQGEVDEIVGIGRTEPNLQRAVELGVIDRYSQDPCQGVLGADLVFLATPVCSIAAVLEKIAPYLAPGCVVTDGGSVKESVVAACEPLMPAGTFFVGGHPIAGTEKSGVDASFATLFAGKRCIVTPTANTDESALRKILRMWELAGSEVIQMDAHKHDRIVAAISHLPHMVAYSLVNAVDGYDRFDESILKYSAGGFRDFTRIASSDPAMWRDISLMNGPAIMEMMDFFTDYFGQLRALIESGDGAGLQRFFTESKRSRDAIL
ncbi:MAG: prephenate dehydrogenase/arogenate dehydrogenase family protein [Deltaproteobacteria bacterium]|nr:prephenate dehydrogenase/arogenate dehydrogenase family protein [Deltaproteobacteria bacterium]TLN01864.1 MAG: prephenate dehydrogenase/arogenate dehydrogenase family protein [bacterium]